MKKLLRHLLWWAIRLPVGLALVLPIWVFGSAGEVLVRFSDALDGFYIQWRQGFVPPWLEDIQRDSQKYTQKWRNRVEDTFDK